MGQDPPAAGLVDITRALHTTISFVMCRLVSGLVDEYVIFFEIVNIGVA